MIEGIFSMVKKELLNLSHEELAQWMESVGEKSFRAAQVFEWIYKKGVMSFDGMKNLSKGLREKLAEQFDMNVRATGRSPQHEISSDGTAKYLFTLSDGEKIETVLIPTKKRNTVCVSTQVGCKFGCKFCASGIGGWERNLSTAEIIGQILYVGATGRSPVQNGRPPVQSGRSPQRITHIVFMGVGEPLDNFSNVMKAIRIINDSKALNIGARRITVSTCGVIPKIKEFAKEGLQIELAISLHGYDNKSRNNLMPVNRKYPFDKIMETCREYTKETNRQITFEYALIKDVTCTDTAVTALKKAFRGLICKMNLIPYNAIEEFEYKSPSNNEIQDFKRKLKDAGIHSTIRASRGSEISGACGQLRNISK